MAITAYIYIYTEPSNWRDSTSTQDCADGAASNTGTSGTNSRATCGKPRRLLSRWKSPKHLCNPSLYLSYSCIDKYLGLVISKHTHKRKHVYACMYNIYIYHYISPCITIYHFTSLYISIYIYLYITMHHYTSLYNTIYHYISLNLTNMSVNITPSI